MDNLGCLGAVRPAVVRLLHAIQEPHRPENALLVACRPRQRSVTTLTARAVCRAHPGRFGAMRERWDVLWRKRAFLHDEELSLSDVMHNGLISRPHWIAFRQTLVKAALDHTVTSDLAADTRSNCFSLLQTFYLSRTRAVPQNHGP